MLGLSCVATCQCGIPERFSKPVFCVVGSDFRPFLGCFGPGFGRPPQKQLSLRAFVGNLGSARFQANVCRRPSQDLKRKHCRECKPEQLNNHDRDAFFMVAKPVALQLQANLTEWVSWVQSCLLYQHIKGLQGRPPEYAWLVISLLHAPPPLCVHLRPGCPERGE